MKYKGYNIGKLSRSVYEGGRDGYWWNVNKDERNVCFNTLREAKEWINKRIKTTMNKKELAKQFPWLTKGELDYELKNGRKEYKTERGFINHLAKENKKNEDTFSMGDISELRIDVEWKRSRYWGNCPRAEWRCWFKDGSFMEGSEYASGCGYDKLSQVVADAFNKVAKGMAWRKRNSRKKAPYGIQNVGKDANKDWRPYFEGGIGANCYKSIAEFLGGKMDWSEGKTWDRFVFTFK